MNKKPRRILRFKDRVTQRDTRDHGGLRGEVIFGTGKHIVEYTDPYGNTAYRTEFEKELFRDTNIVPIGGYQFVFDKLFNIGLDQETTLRVGDLNDEAPQMKIGVPRGQYKSLLYNSETGLNNNNLAPVAGINISANNFVFGFMMGDGGSREDNMTAIAPDYKNRGLYHAIPFRMSNDGEDIPSGKYFGKYTSSAIGNTVPITSYYVKKFDDPKPHIVHAWATGKGGSFDAVDDTVFSSTSSLDIESYVEINLSISDMDGRGFFTSTGTTPRVNEIGLVSGWYNAEQGDYESLRLMTHFCRPSIILDEGDAVDAIYRLYAR